MNKPYHVWTSPHAPVWGQAFRPLFLLGALFSAGAVLVWGLWLNGLIERAPFDNPIFWHSHEMMFGFVGAIITGFLLTAVQNWTGLRALNGLKLQLLVGVWVAARVAIVFATPEYVLLAALMNVVFFGLAAFSMGQLLFKARNTRNYFFIPALLGLGALSGLSHYGVAANSAAIHQGAMYAAVLLISQMIMIVGGRVIPMFTASGTGTERIKPARWLNVSLYVASWLSIPMVVLGIYEAAFRPVAALILVVACLANAARIASWCRAEIWAVPLVWSLHLGYLFIPFGQGLLALHFSGFAVPLSAGVHALAVGAMGTMILAMISRVSLGHTGRALSVNRAVTASFIFIVIAALLRVLLGVILAISGSAALLSVAVFWSLAYFLFIVNYWKILISPRADGRPG